MVTFIDYYKWLLLDDSNRESSREMIISRLNVSHIITWGLSLFKRKTDFIHSLKKQTFFNFVRLSLAIIMD